MRRLALALLLTSALGAAPKAVITAPGSAATGSIVRPDWTGTVSDELPLVLVWGPTDGAVPVFTAAQALAGFALNKPGTYTFFVVASGRADAASPVTSTLASCVTVVTGQVVPPVPPPTPPPTPIPTPIPTPTPTPQVLPFTAAYRAYSKGMGAALTSISADVRAGKVATKQQFLDALRAHSAPFSAAIDGLFAPGIDAAGRITNPAGIADAIDAAVRAAP